MSLNTKGITFERGLLAMLIVAACFVAAVPAYSRVASPEALQPGEVLVYDVSWSRMVSAGTAVMEVRQGTRDGKEVLDLVLTGRSRGLMEKLFPVNDRVLSQFDPEHLRSVSYDISESFGKRKRHKSLLFDRKNNTVVFNTDNELPLTLAVPAGSQDGLASLYYLRTRKDFVVGKTFSVDVHDSGKNWSIEVLTLGREHLSTPAGEFDTIMLRTRPLYDGVYLGKGEVQIWLTDDSRRVPVLMKSSIKVGSFVFLLTAQKPGIPVTQQALAATASAASKPALKPTKSPD